MSDAERFERIYRSTYAALTAYARRRLPAREIDDVVANVYLAVWRKLDSVPSDPLPWLYRAAWLEIASAHRTASRQPIPPADPDQDVGAALPDHSDETADRVSVAAALERLPARDAEILRLRSEAVPGVAPRLEVLDERGTVIHDASLPRG